MGQSHRKWKKTSMRGLRESPSVDDRIEDDEDRLDTERSISNHHSSQALRPRSIRKTISTRLKLYEYMWKEGREDPIRGDVFVDDESEWQCLV